ASEKPKDFNDIGVTQILDAAPKTSPPPTKKPIQTVQTVQTFETPKQTKPPKPPAPIQPVKPAETAVQPQKTYTPDFSGTSEIHDIKPSKRKKERKEKEPKPKHKDFAFHKAKIVPKPIIEAEIDPDLEESIKPEKPEKPEKQTRANRGEAISIAPKPAKEKKEAEGFDFPKLNDTQVIEKPLTPAEEALKKRGEALLERDLALDNPLEQIDALNPYDMLEPRSDKDKEQTDDDTIPVGSGLNGEKSQKFVSLLSGDTNGIADGDLKKLAEKTADKPHPEKTAEVIKTYIPSVSKSKHKEKPAEHPANVTLLSEKERRSNTALIESLNKALKEKRASDVSAYRTLSTGVSQPRANQPLTHGLNIDYKKQILTDTSLPLHEDPKFIEQKMQELAGKRKRKIRDFVLEDIDDESALNDYSEEYDENDFDNYDTSGQIWNDLCETHKGLKIRAFLLLIITGFLTGVTFMNDMGFNMAYNILGVDVYFMDKVQDPAGFLYLNLILGMAGILLCTTVVKGGFAKLFTGRADCDSLCAVPAVVSTLSVVPMLNGTGFFQQRFTNIFVAAGLFGLFFNTAGKLIMMSRAKRNFRFISGDNQKYYAEIIEDEQVSRAFTKGVTYELPVLCGMRKTEFLTDFLKNSYCNDKADQLCRFLAPAAFGAALVIGLASMFLPYSSNTQLEGNIFWALTAANAALCLLSPLSIMFLVNNPLLRASKALAKNDSVVLGYNAAEKFSKVNSVLVDASSLFPAGSVDFRTLKRCQPPNSLIGYAIDDAIITAASLAIKSGSILTSMFYDMIAGKNDLLYDIENCIYEVNMGISGWMGNKRVMLGNREQMKHHGIKVPDYKKEQQYSNKFGDVVYLAVGGETIAMFFLKIVPNEQIKRSLQALQKHGVSVIVRTKDSIVTVNSLVEAFELAPENLKIIPFDLHAKFEDCTKYSSRGDGGASCSGTFSSFASTIVAAKKIIHNIILSSSSLFTGLFLAVIFALIFTVFSDTNAFSSTSVILYNSFFFGAMMLMQGLKKY
ncbi:MAG: hypothetical protein FWG44_05755, partial [Oscillospiraceae bacterium]|nr:hypothetical protein [Oscillospiraceae bacterium]